MAVSNTGLGPEELGPCAWCGQPAIDLIYTEGSPTTRKNKKAPVCGEHYRKFRLAGLPSRNDHYNKREPRFG